jgi:CBS domain-containing protein
MTDWMRALSRGAGPDKPISEVMAHHPIAVDVEDDGAAAALIIREYRLKNLPVVDRGKNGQLVGCLRTRRLMAHVFDRVAHPQNSFPSMKAA